MLVSDNGGNIGCKDGCTPDLGFICTGENGRSSICLSTCNDGIKASDEKCDNGGLKGCTNNCVPDLGF